MLLTGSGSLPVVDNGAARRDARRAYLKGLKRGDLITCDLSMKAVGMSCGGTVRDMTPAPSAAQVDAERLAEKKREDDRVWLKSIGPW